MTAPDCHRPVNASVAYLLTTAERARDDMRQPMAQFFLEDFQWHGVKRGDAFAFYAGDIRVEGPYPFCSSGNLGNGRTRTAMYTDSIEQLRGAAGARQVRVRARDCAGGVHHAKQRRLDHVRQIPELTARDTAGRRLAVNHFSDDGHQ